VLVVTGVWNITAVHATWSGQYGRTLILKVAVVTASGIAAWAHTASRSRRGLAVWGALSALAALGALFLGVVLHG
jgi:hypothetical protein